jgi:3',5'-cyclic AMP phosphodiesterase CpdA
MKRIAWLTDIHLNFLLAAQLQSFLGELRAARPDAVLLSGDIGESHSVCGYLEQLSDGIAVPIYFVLGNHDFYHGSIAETRGRVLQLGTRHANLHYLLGEDFVQLTPHVGLVGHDGWADGRLGDYPRSLVEMHDHKLISELAPHDKLSRWEVLKQLGEQAAVHLHRVLPLAFQSYRDVVLLTHVPPFREACWHAGALSDDQWAPHFTCQAVGAVLLECMAAHPDQRLTVLCGHTHGRGECQPLKNLQVFTGGAEYGHPIIERVLELD